MRVFQLTGMGCTHPGVLCPLELLGALPSPALYTGYKLPLPVQWMEQEPSALDSIPAGVKGWLPDQHACWGEPGVCPPFQRPQLEGWLWGNWNSFGYFGFFNYGLGLDGFRIELQVPGNDGWYICGFNT